MIDKIIGSGVFPDVTGGSGRFWHIARIGDPRVSGHIAISTWLEGKLEQFQELVRYPVPGGTPAFPRIYYYPITGHLWFAYHDGNVGILRNASTDQVMTLSPCHNNDPICFGSHWVAWQGAQIDHWPITRMHLKTGVKFLVGNGAGTGLSRILDDGTVRLVDEDRVLVPGGTRPCWAADLVVVEAFELGVRGTLTDGKEQLLWPGMSTITPRCAFGATKKIYAISTWSNQDGSIRVAETTAADFAAPKPPDPKPPDPPKPPVVRPLRFTISEPRFPLSVPLVEGETLSVRCVITLEPGSGPADWFEWDISTKGPQGPWTTDVRVPGTDFDHTYTIKVTSWIRARGGNAAGTHGTQAERKITITTVPKPKPPDPPDPKPPEGEGVPFKTLNGHYLREDEHGIIDARADKSEDASRIVKVNLFSDVYALKIGAKYIQARDGGGSQLQVVERSEPFADEQFRLGRVPGGFTIQATASNLFTCAEGGGGGDVNINRQVAQGWETFIEEGSGGGGGSAASRWHMESGRFKTEAGLWITPRGYSVFHAPALVRDGNLPELRRQFDRAQAARCNLVRVFGQWHFIGGGLTPYSVSDPHWFEWMDVVLNEASSRGLNVACSYFCDAQVLQPDEQERIRLFESLAHWAIGKPTLLVMTANEARKNGWGEADDPALLDLVRRFRSINTVTLLGASDPLDAGQEGQDAEDYNKAQENIHRQSPVDFLLVHAHRKDRYAWVDHLKGASETPDAVGFNGICWHEEPMGGASHDVAGRRDSSPIAHIAAACVGAMCGGYTYMHRQLEDDVAPGLVESGIASEIPGSPDYHLINATLPGSPVAAFTEFDKCRTCSNGAHGWAVAYGEHEGTITLAGGWHEVRRERWSDGTGCCILLEVSK